MTFDTRLCEDAFDTLGRDHALRHAYRVYLWRRALGLVHHARSNDGPTASADICSGIKHPLPLNDMLNALDTERALRM